MSGNRNPKPATTSVELKRTTVRMLEDPKRKYGAKCMDETVRRLIVKAESIPGSMFGAHPEMKPFTRKKEAPHEL